MKKTKIYAIIIVGTTCFSILIIFALLSSSSNHNTQNIGGVNDITLIVDYGDGTQKIKEKFDLPPGQTTAFDALNKWCDVKYDDYGTMGYLVTSIDGKSGSWIFFVNDKSPDQSSIKVYLNDGDVVKWKRI